ncbi:hydrolase [Bacillus sp. JCM 19046]|nr:hydrolase [Bacillus sp. JCM 19045]GAF17099.1 hydrolase [Bacillus sp. JCM 19046]
MWKRELVHTARGVFEVFRKGRGTPLCVTHYYSTFNESGDYFADVFTKTHSVILINLRESGYSEKAKDPHQLSFIETVLDIEGIRQALGFDKWGFAGHSTGGMLGLVYGIHFSESLVYTIIVGAAARDYQTFSVNCIYHNQHPLFERMQTLLKVVADSTRTEEEKKSFKIERTKLSLYEPSNHLSYFNKSIRKSINPIRLAFFSREMTVFDLTRKLSLIEIPSLIVCGEHDVQCPVEYSIEMAEAIVASKLVIFVKSNHYPFLEKAERFEQEVNKFIREVNLTGQPKIQL